MSNPQENLQRAPIDLFPSLGSLIKAGALDPTKLSIAVRQEGERVVRITDKHVISVSDGDKVLNWPVARLAELFRGDKLPPADMNHYPPEYVEHFFFIERQLMMLNDIMGDRTDQEMEEVYSAIRRRPDGRSLGIAHDFIWQVAALLLGKHALSEAEFESIFSALVTSTRRWSKRPVSRFYAAYLRNTFANA